MYDRSTDFEAPQSRHFFIIFQIATFLLRFWNKKHLLLHVSSLLVFIFLLTFHNRDKVVVFFLGGIVFRHILKARLALPVLPEAVTSSIASSFLFPLPSSLSPISKCISLPFLLSGSAGWPTE